MTFSENTARLTEALARLPQKYKTKANFQSIVSVFMAEFNELESVYVDLYDELNIEDAVGSQLDVWGQILDVPRNGTDDDTYRIRLKAAIYRYVSSGKWEEVIQGFTILTNPRYIQATEVFPAAIFLIAVGADPVAVDDSEIFNAMTDLKPAGVRITALVVAPDPPFVFFGDPDASGEGFGDRTNPSVGGYLAVRLEA